MVNQSRTLKQQNLKQQVGEDWDDIIQTAKLRTLKYYGKLEYNRILTRTIHNLAVNLLTGREVEERAKTRLQETVKAQSTGIHGELAYETDFGAIHDVRQTLSQWPQNYRDAFQLYFSGEITFREAQRMLRMTHGFAYRWLRKAKKSFKKELQSYA